jgi:hypothetical protein
MSKTWSPWKQHKNQLLLGFLLVLFLICSLDFWNWKNNLLGFFGFPLWIWYLLILTVLLSFIYYIIIVFFWRDSDV